MSAPVDTRIRFLDGMRGIAIFWVLLFHAYVRWPEVLPYGSLYSGRPWFAYGWLGVQLFFLISGFVISMTLERSRGFGDFMWKRWLRLFPAMLLCSLLIFATAGLFPERPAGLPVPRDLLPGLSFIDPAWWDMVLPGKQGVLEGAFWSLFVEMKFYVIAGLLYFAGGRNLLVVGLAAVFLLGRGALALPAGEAGDWIYALQRGGDLLSAKYFGWFAAGALFHRYYFEKSRVVLVLALLTAFAAAAAQDGYQYRPDLFAACVVLLFALGVVFEPFRRLLANPLLQFLGFVSYPLYLVHENMMVASIAKVGAQFPSLPPLLMPVLPMVLVITIGRIVARHLEPRLRNRIRNRFAPPRSLPAASGSDA